MILRKLKQWVGIPAPAKLEHDDWFPIPEELKEPEPVAFTEDITLETKSENYDTIPQHKLIEDEFMHDWVYREATKNTSTTLHLNPPGGSENLHGDEWQSGTGMGQFR